MTTRTKGRNADTHEKVIEICHGPKCPHCALDTFDDWWHGEKLRSPGGPVVAIEGSIKCHGCGKFFSITHYHDGETHSTAWKRKPKVQSDER